MKKYNKLILNTLSNEELINYIEELDGEIYDLKTQLKFKTVQLDKSILLINDILESGLKLKNDHELNNRLTFKNELFNVEIDNLITYIKKYCIDCKLYLR